jgi:predicted nucleic acid-binding protein
MIVVADASPLNYLIQINCEGLLRDLYKTVLVPVSVLEELGHPSAPAAVAAWLLHPRSWIDVRTVRFRKDASLEALDRGEREAIQLAEEQHANLLLIDERLGRSEAKRRGISTTGTLGILLAGGGRRLIEPVEAFQQLIERTNFRATPKLKESFVEHCRTFQNRK